MTMIADRSASTRRNTRRSGGAAPTSSAASGSSSRSSRGSAARAPGDRDSLSLAAGQLGRFRPANSVAPTSPSHRVVRATRRPNRLVKSRVEPLVQTR